jgi:opacity protein-like surface antigen
VLKKMMVKDDHSKTCIMKKLLVLLIVLLVSGALMAQGSKKIITPKSFLAFHAGPSIPMGDFHSTNFNNTDAGFAKTGYNLNLSYGYQFIEDFGITANLFYNNNKLDNPTIQREMETELGLNSGDLNGLNLDHWKWYGLSVGPAIMHNLTPDLAADVKVMGGIVNVNTPKITFGTEQLVGEDWSVAPVLQAGIGLRIGVGKNMFVLTSIDYLYMKPKFNVETNIQELVAKTFKQKISTVNITGGFGIRF